MTKLPHQIIPSRGWLGERLQVAPKALSLKELEKNSGLANFVTSIKQHSRSTELQDEDTSVWELLELLFLENSLRVAPPIKQDSQHAQAA